MQTMDEKEREARADRARLIIGELAERGVAAVAVTWVDNSGLTRVKAVPLARLPHAAAWGIGASPVFDTFLVDDSPVVGRFAGGPVGDLRLHPDLDRIVVLSAQPGWAWAPANRHDQQGAPHPQDHRAIAAHQAARLAELGYTVRAAFEVEWVVSRGDGDEFVPAAPGPGYGMARLAELSDYVREIVLALAAEDVELLQIHPEYAPGQFEVSVAAEDPVGAADTCVLVRETIRAITLRHGFRASFSPQIVAGGVGNGAHVHLSLWRDGVNVMAGGTGRFGLTHEGESFIAGLLSHLPALLAIGAPSVSSYLRLVPRNWAGAFACWGLENREAALRLVTGPVGSEHEAANIEVKCIDASANPYLVVAALLASACSGLATGTELPDPVGVDPATLEPEILRERGIRRLPSSLDEAVAALEADTVLRQALGDELTDTLATVRRGEIALFADADPDEITARTRWRH